MPKIKAIISDADGTLVDTLHLIRHGQYETAKKYLTQHGIPEDNLPTYQAYEHHLHQVLGGSARETLERTVRLLYQKTPANLVGIDFDALHALLNPIQDKIAPKYVKAFAGLQQMLEWLGKEQVSLAVFTSGTPHHIVRNFGIALPGLGMTTLFTNTQPSELEKLAQLEQKLEQVFSILKVTFVTCNDVSATKPDPESILVAMDRLDISRDEAAILGDHWVDMEAGKNAGVLLRIGVSHGFDDEAKLEKAGATHVIHKLDELRDVLK